MAKKPKKKPVMPAVPRDARMATFSELVPIRSKKIKIWKSPAFIITMLMAIAGTVSIVMMSLIQAETGQGMLTLSNLTILSAAMILAMLTPILAGLYFYCRPGKPFWFYLIPVAIVAVITGTPIFDLFALPFRGILPTMQWAFAPNQPFLNFVGMFFAAGLTEEYIKCIPAFVCAMLAFRVVDGKAKADPDSIWPLRGPVDGVMMGLAGGMGFILAETAMQYVPNIAAQTAGQTGDLGMSLANGLLLLIPRTVGNLTGHMGWSAMVGYAIGLAVIRPGMRWKIMLIGVLAASVLHAFWNSLGQYIPFGLLISAVFMAFVAAAVILKARQLALVEGNTEIDTMGSIVVPKDAKRPAPAPAPAPPAASAPPPPPRPAPAPRAAAEAEKPVMMQVDGVSFPLRAGENLGFADDPRLAGKAAGVEAAVVAHPTKPNVVGLRNAGQGAWTARLRDGSKQVIEHNQNIRLAPTVQVDFGNGLVGTVVEVG